MEEQHDIASTKMAVVNASKKESFDADITLNRASGL
jgi:hypothetical protein